MNLLRSMLVTVALAGCATLERPFSDHLGSEAIATRDCAAWFAALDEAVDSAGVRDAQEARIAGFPYLRANRFLGALKHRAGTDAGPDSKERRPVPVARAEGRSASADEDSAGRAV